LEKILRTSTFGDAIRQRRYELGMTQEQLAERTGDCLRQLDVKRLELGLILMPHWKWFERLAEALEWSVTDLMRAAGFSR
jgi:transcriptional regulator with XRE-family HTH domain